MHSNNGRLVLHHKTKSHYNARACTEHESFDDGHMRYPRTRAKTDTRNGTMRKNSTTAHSNHMTRINDAIITQAAHCVKSKKAQPFHFSFPPPLFYQWWEGHSFNSSVNGCKTKRPYFFVMNKEIGSEAIAKLSFFSHIENLFSRDSAMKINSKEWMEQESER